MHVLLVEDDRAIAESVVAGLRGDGHEVVHVETGGGALGALGLGDGAAFGGDPAGHEEPIELVLLDLGLADIDGRDVCATIRRHSAVPVIMLTARGDEIDRVLGLELGADDYVTKPFGMREVLARIRAVARRSNTGADNASGAPIDHAAQSIGPLTIDRPARRVFLDGGELTLTAKEFDVLALLASEPGVVRSRTDILEQAWDINWYGPTKTVDAHVAAIRRKLGDARWIVAVHGVGFRFEAPSDRPRR